MRITIKSLLSLVITVGAVYFSAKYLLEHADVEKNDVDVIEDYRNRIISECELINHITKDYPYYDVEVPEEFIEISGDGLSFKVPPEVHSQKPFHLDYYYDGVDGGLSDSTIFISFYDAYTHPAFDLYEGVENKKYIEKQLEELFQSAGMSVPENIYEYTYCTFNLNMDKYNPSNGYQAEYFYTLAKRKDKLYIDNNYLNVYNFEKDGIRGYVHEISNEDEVDVDFENLYLVRLFTGENESCERMATVFADDMETVKQIIASVEVTAK